MLHKKAQIQNIIYLIAVLFLVLLVGFGMAFGGVVVDWVFDEAVPEISGIGQVGSANVTEISAYTLTPLNSVVQSFTWLAGVFYLLALIGCFGLAVAFRMTGGKWLMGFFIACMFLLIVASMFLSNIYEEFYNDGSEIGIRLHEYGLLSWFILYSPLVMGVIGFVSGIIMFTGDPEPGGFA